MIQKRYISEMLGPWPAWLYAVNLYEESTQLYNIICVGVWCVILQLVYIGMRCAETIALPLLVHGELAMCVCEVAYAFY